MTRRSAGRRAAASASASRSCRFPGSAPARISSRARSSTARAVGDRERVVHVTRTSSSTDGRSRSSTKMSVEPPRAATLQIVRRVGADHGCRARCARCRGGRGRGSARRRVLGEAASRASRSPRSSLRGRSRSSSDGKTYDVQPGEALRVDGTATQAALVEAGHELPPPRPAARRPEPAVLAVDPVLVARPQRRGRRRARFPRRCRSPAAPRSSRADGSFSIIPSQPGDAVDADAAWSPSLAKAALTGVRTLSPALTHVEPELTTPAAEAAVAEATDARRRAGRARRSRARTSARSRRSGSRSCSASGSVATASASRSTRSGSPRPSSRCSRHGGQRAVNARFVVDGKRVRIRPSRPGLAVDGSWAADSIAAAADVVVQPGLSAPEADPRRPHDRARRRSSASGSRSPRSRPTWARPRRTGSTTSS